MGPASACQSLGARRRPVLRQAIGTSPPVGHLGFVDLVAHVIGRRQTRSRPDRAIDIDHAAADSADQMMMVVADPILEAGR